jgi:HSP20 family molecular chaperone IbpA
LSDDIDDFFEKMKKFFNFNADPVDLDFYLFPTDKPEMEFNPEEIKSKGFKVSYHYDSGMDKPEIKIDGDIDENKLKDYLKNFDFNKVPELHKLHSLPKKEEIDASDLTLEPTEHKHGLHVLEPNIETNDFDNFIEFILELPGIEKKDIFLHFNKSGEKLTITAHNSERRYFKSLDLPFKSSLEDVSFEVNNGIAVLKVMKQNY